MALDSRNLKLQIVKVGDDARFKQFAPKEGEPHFRMNKRYLSVGDGSTKGGFALASRQFIENAIKIAEETGTTSGIPVD